jgi:hypothetical protein
MVGALGTSGHDYTFVDTPSTEDNPATANAYGKLVLGYIDMISCHFEEWETVTEGIEVCGFRYDTVPLWNMDTPWPTQERAQNSSTLIQNIFGSCRPEINLFSHGLLKRYIVFSSEWGQLSDTFSLMKRAFELDVRIEKTLLDMLSHEPEFLPIVTDMVETFVEDLRAWDGGAEFLIRAFTDPDASGRETLQFVVHYSDDIPRDKMNRKWDEAADKLDEIIPTKEQRLRVGISFQSFL